MTDATKYNPKVAWKTVLNNVFQLTKETVDNPATYRATIKIIDSNNVGAGQVQMGFCCYDFMGNPYPIIATGTNTIDVIDIFRIKLCPTSGKTAVIIEPVINGESLYLSQENFQGLHPLALANAHKYDIPVLWDKMTDKVQILSGLTPTWDIKLGIHATLTLSGNTTITLSNLIAGMSGNLTITNPSAIYTLTFAGYTNEISPAIWKVDNQPIISGLTLKDCLSWFYDGSLLFWNGTNGYKP